MIFFSYKKREKKENGREDGGAYREMMEGQIWSLGGVGRIV
jgi:hypothetical protein